MRAAATVLGLSSKTVDAHKFNLMRKLGIHNKAELVMWAIQTESCEDSGQLLGITAVRKQPQAPQGWTPASPAGPPPP